MLVSCSAFRFLAPYEALESIRFSMPFTCYIECEAEGMTKNAQIETCSSLYTNS